MILLWTFTGRPRRAGFAVARHIRGAVERNRAKRRLKEAYRAVRHEGPDHVDVVLIARQGAVTSAFTVLREHVRELLAAIPRGPA